jgi:hypothetical protein
MGFEEVIEAVNRTDLSLDPPAALQQCERAWEAAHAALLAARLSEASLDVGSSHLLVQALCRWRGARARLALGDASDAQYLVQCAVRLLLLNEFQRLGPEERAELRRLAGGGRSPLCACEERELVEFEPLSGRQECLRRVEEASRAWSRAPLPPGLAAQCAFALLFVQDCDASVPCGLLAACSRLDCAETRREQLRHLLERQAEDGLAQSDAVERWTRARAAGSFGEDATARFAEALVAAELGPLDAPESGEAPSATLARGEPERATRVMARAKRAARLLGAEDARSAEEDTLVLCLFGYFMEQLHNVQFEKMFCATGSAPQAAIEKLQRYKDDRMVSPPPMLVLCLGSWYVVYRSVRPGQLERVHRYARASQALACWMAWVRAERGCTVAAGRSVARLLDEISAPPEAAATVQLTLAPIGGAG